MSYATLMVHLELGRPNTGLLKIAAALAERFQAGVIGIAAGQPPPMLYREGYVPDDLFQQSRDVAPQALTAAEAEFRHALAGRFPYVEWRSTDRCVDLADYVAEQSRAADLVLTCQPADARPGAPRPTNVVQLLLQAGGPVLIVPANAETLPLAHALIGWKDALETRRAVKDALPLLKRASRVSVVEIASEADSQDALQRVRDVAEWLGRHGIEAESTAQISTGDEAVALQQFAARTKVDLLVAGAYGHSRLREWVLGGVTRDLLLRSDQCSLLSH